MRIVLLLYLPMLVGTTGCLSETRSYSLSIKSELATPVSVCVTKLNSPPELGWEAPEDLILPPNPPSDQTPPGMVIPAGRTLKIDKLTGRFDKERGRAILRVYAGTPNLTEMSAISEGSINRLDVPLNQGINRMVIVPESGGGMKAVPAPALQMQPSHP